MFSTNSRLGSRPVAFPVLRVQPGKVVVATIQSKIALIVTTHWAGRRLWCALNECPACGLLPSREIVYALATVKFGPTVRTVLLESTWGQYQGWLDVDGVQYDACLAGVRVEVSRTKAKAPLGFKACDDLHDILATPLSERVCWSEQLAGKVPLMGAAARIAGLASADEGEDPGMFHKRIRPAMRDLLLLHIEKMKQV